MQDIYANSNEGVVFQTFSLVGAWKGGGGDKNEPLESPPRLADLFQNFLFKFDIAWFVLWSLAQKEVLNLLHIYVVVLSLGTHNPCNRRYLLHISLCLSTT